MKRIFLILLLLLAGTLISCAQPLVQRAGPANTVNDPRHRASLNSIHPTYRDTVEASLPAHIGLDSAGAIIYTEDIKGFWYRQHSPKKWVRFSDVSASTVNTIQVISDSSVLVCTGEGACDTLNFDTHIVNVSSSYFLSDTSIVICNATACDTALIPRQPVYLFQNGLTTSGTITEWGGTLLHNTTLDAGYHSVLFTAARLYDYPWRFYQQQGNPATTGIAAFGRAGHGEQPNRTWLSLNFWDSTFQRSPFIGGYFGRRTGYALATNLTAQIEGHLRLDDTAAKVAGIFFNTTDSEKNNEAFTLFGLPKGATPVDAYYSPADSLAGGKILTGRTSGDLTLWAYDSSRNDGVLSKALGTDAQGNVILGTLPTATFTSNNGLTNSSATNVQLGGTLLKTTTVNTTGAYQMIFTGANPSAATMQVMNTSSSQGLYASSVSGTGLYARSTSNTGLATYSETSISAVLGVGGSDNTASREILKLQRETSSGIPAAGMGAYIGTHIKTASGNIKEASRVGTRWSDAGTATNTALWEVSLAQAGAPVARRLALSGAGKLTLDTYGDGTHTGTATYGAAFDGDGNVLEVPLAGGTASLVANNGLNKSGDTVQLGGALLENTFITSSTPAYRLTLSGVSTFAEGAQLDVITSGSVGIAVRGETTNGRGVYGVSTSNGVGVYGITQSGTGVFATATSGTGVSANSATGLAMEGNVQPASTNTVVPVLALHRSSSAGAGNGIGGAIEFHLQGSDGANKFASRLVSKLTDITAGAQSSLFELHGVQGGTTYTLLTVSGAGVVTLVQGLATYSDNAAALAGGMSAGQLYKTATGQVMIVY